MKKTHNGKHMNKGTISLLKNTSAVLWITTNNTLTVPVMWQLVIGHRMLALNVDISW